MNLNPNRRHFIGGSTVAALGFWMGSDRVNADPAPKDKLKVAAIGVEGKGSSDLADLARGNVVIALCDADRNKLANAAKKFPEAKLFTDYRKMLDEVGRELDAITVSTPDHHHAPAALRAMAMGIGAFVQKPMAHTITEARLMREMAVKMKVASQMGNQGTSNSMLREAVDVLHAGAIGKVTELHVWTNRPVWPQGLDRPAGEDPVPDWLDWDAYIGPAAMRPYKQDVYHPFKWRGWYDFGAGALGDMGCHTMNMPVWGLKLGHPTSIELVEKSDDKPETFPKWSILRYEFPARGEMAPVTFTWYDGGKKPPADLFPDGQVPNTGALLIGDKGVMVSAGDYGSGYKLLPGDDFKDYKAPAAVIPKSPGHMVEFVNMCKGGAPAWSNFELAGPLTEVVVLGNLCLHSEKKIEWDGENLKATNAPELNAWINKEYRAGWELTPIPA